MPRHFPLFVVWFTASLVTSSPANELSPEPFLRQFCYECHSGEEAEADLQLDTLAFDQAAFLDHESAAKWQEVRDSLYLGEMPPKKAPQPDEAVSVQVADWLAERLQTAEAMAQSTGGEVLIRRMTRQEYANTIRDLTGLEWVQGESPMEVLPEDSEVHDFKKMSKGLTLDASLMGLYVDVAQEIAKRTVATTEQPAFPKEIRRQSWRTHGKFDRDMQGSFEADATADGKAILRDGKFHTLGRWFDELHYGETDELHPVKGKYVVRIHAWSRNANEGKPVTLVTRNWNHPPKSGESWELVLSERPQVFEFTYFIDELNAPGSKNFVLEVRNGTELINDDTVHSRRLGFEKQRSRGGAKETPELLRKQARQTARASMEGFFHHRIPSSATLELDQHPYAVIDWVEIEGPIQPWPPIVQEQYFTAADGSLDIETGMKHFMARAFRRPVADGEVEKVLTLVRSETERLGNPRKALQAGIAAVLSSPHFLYLSGPNLPPAIEADPRFNAETREVNAFELASRLSYFLWSTTPDPRLLQLAMSGQIRNPDVLRAEVDRMLADPKAKALTEGFATQWLRVDEFNKFDPSTEIYGKVEPELLDAMEQEALAFFEEILHRDQSVLNFIQSDFTMLNERLAKFYGIKEVQGEEFQKVSLPPDLPRGGLLTMAGVHRYGSDGVRTKPVTRGVYVKEVFFNDPPNPPPPNAGEIEPNIEGENLTVKERLKQHKQIETCAACHRKIDPYGVALENFDVMGQWREFQNGENFSKRDAPPIDPSGEFTNGNSFQTFDEFITLMVEDKERFCHALTEKFVMYALGRDVAPYEESEVDRISRTMAADGYKMRTMIKEIVTSNLFKRK